MGSREAEQLIAKTHCGWGGPVCGVFLRLGNEKQLSVLDLPASWELRCFTVAIIYTLLNTVHLHIK